MTEENTFTGLIETSRNIIFKVIRLYVNDPEDEKDLYQEILFQAWRSYPNFKGNSKFSTWLYKVALNTVLTFKRRPQIVKTHDDLASLNRTETNTSQAEEVDALYTAIRSLSNIDRMIITLHLDGYDNEEIAEIAGLTKNHAGVKLFRIRETLIKKLKSY